MLHHLPEICHQESQSCQCKVKRSYKLDDWTFQKVATAVEMLDHPAVGPNLLFLEDQKFQRNTECVRLEHCVSNPGYVVYTIYDTTDCYNPLRMR